MYDELIKALREEAEWAEGNKWETPIMLSDHLTQAADAIEKLEAYLALYKDCGETALRVAEEARPRWISVEDKLPDRPGCYIVYLVSPIECNIEFLDSLSYVTMMYFNQEQMIWVDENDSYNAIPSVVNKDKSYHVSHWMEKPIPPKEETK